MLCLFQSSFKRELGATCRKGEPLMDLSLVSVDSTHMDSISKNEVGFYHPFYRTWLMQLAYSRSNFPSPYSTSLWTRT